MRIKDLEAHLVRQLEQQVLAALPSLLAAQVVLAELDCLLSLAACARDLELARPTTLRRHSPLPRRPSLSGLVAPLTETRVVTH